MKIHWDFGFIIRSLLLRQSPTGVGIRRKKWVPIAFFGRSVDICVGFIQLEKVTKVEWKMYWQLCVCVCEAHFKFMKHTWNNNNICNANSPRRSNLSTNICALFSHTAIKRQNIFSEKRIHALYVCSVSLQAWSQDAAYRALHEWSSRYNKAVTLAHNRAINWMNISGKSLHVFWLGSLKCEQSTVSQ